MAASNSVRKEIGARSGRGQSSVRKMATPSASGTAMQRASSEVARVPKMKGSAPKSPATGSHASRVKNFQPNAARLGRECRTRMPKMNTTMAKMLKAHRSVSAAKLLSARAPLPRLLRKSRMADTLAPAVGTESCASSADGLGRMGGTGSGDLEFRSSVIRIDDTILIFLSARFSGRLYPAMGFSADG